MSEDLGMLNQLKQEVLELKQRNARVESEKAWETSFARRLSISVFTYVVAECWLLIIHEPNSWLKSFVPVAGFILSTLSLPPIKKYWLSKKINK